MENETTIYCLREAEYQMARMASGPKSAPTWSGKTLTFKRQASNPMPGMEEDKISVTPRCHDT